MKQVPVGRSHASKIFIKKGRELCHITTAVDILANALTRVQLRVRVLVQVQLALEEEEEEEDLRLAMRLLDSSNPRLNNNTSRTKTTITTVSTNMTMDTRKITVTRHRI